MKLIKVICLTTLFFIMGYMLQFIDYTFRLFSQNSIWYSVILVMILSGLIFLISKQLKLSDLDFNFQSLKMLLTMVLSACGLLIFYAQYSEIINEHQLIIIFYLFFAIIITYLYTTILSKINLKELFTFFGYVLLIVLINFILEMFADSFDFQLLKWVLYAISTSIFMLSYYCVASFVITKERLNIALLSINMISILLLARSIFVIIILLTTSK